MFLVARTLESGHCGEKRRYADGSQGEADLCTKYLYNYSYVSLNLVASVKRYSCLTSMEAVDECLESLASCRWHVMPDLASNEQSLSHDSIEQSTTPILPLQKEYSTEGPRLI